MNSQMSPILDPSKDDPVWRDFIGHRSVIHEFQAKLDNGRLGSTFLFIGASGVGKRRFAHKLAQCLLCRTTSEARLTACGSCATCRQVLAGTHPDLEQIAKPEDKSFIPVEFFIGDKQHRMREGLCPRIAMKPVRGGRKIAIIDDADFLNQEGANCLLKILEEPPPRSVLILIGTSAQRQLPTIRSRCQLVRFRRLAESDAARLLCLQGVATSEGAALQLYRLADGDVQQTRRLADPEVQSLHQELSHQLSQSDWNSVALAAAVTEFVDAAGKDAPIRRERLRTVIELVIHFYRQLMRHRTLDQHDNSVDAETAADCLERCLDALAYVSANANMATNIDAWIDQLSQRTCH